MPTSIRSARSPFQNAIARRRASRASISLMGATSAMSRAVSLLQLGRVLVLDATNGAWR